MPKLTTIIATLAVTLSIGLAATTAASAYYSDCICYVRGK